MPLSDFACKNAAPTYKLYRLTDRGDGLTLEVSYDVPSENVEFLGKN